MLSFVQILVEDHSNYICSSFINEIEMHTSSLEHVASFECITELFIILSPIILFISFFSTLQDINFNFRKCLENFHQQFIANGIRPLSS